MNAYMPTAIRLLPEAVVLCCAHFLGAAWPRVRRAHLLLAASGLLRVSAQLQARGAGHVHH